MGCTGNIAAVIGYVESHIEERLTLGTIARASHYSPYHLHRKFLAATGTTLHNYVRRRRLTEAARQLAFSNQSISEIALLSGYGSQQAFSSAFTAMYKQTPCTFRTSGQFYPLQLPLVLNSAIMPPVNGWAQRITPALPGDIPAWMDLARAVVDGFPHFNEEDYRKALEQAIRQGHALMIHASSAAAGGILFSPASGAIDFLGVHPQYRRRGIAKAFLRHVAQGLSKDTKLNTTTFRAGDAADNGARWICQHLGFVEDALLIEFNYPTQRFQMPRDFLGGVL